MQGSKVVWKEILIDWLNFFFGRLCVAERISYVLRLFDDKMSCFSHIMQDF